MVCVHIFAHMRDRVVQLAAAAAEAEAACNQPWPWPWSYTTLGDARRARALS